MEAASSSEDLIDPARLHSWITPGVLACALSLKRRDRQAIACRHASHVAPSRGLPAALTIWQIESKEKPSECDRH